MGWADLFVLLLGPPGAVEITTPELPAPREVRSTPDRLLTWTAPDAGMIVVRDRHVVWTDPNGEPRRTLDCPGMDPGDIVEASAPDRAVGVLLTSGRICLWDLGQNAPARDVRSRGAAHFALSGTTVALGYRDGTVELRDVGAARATWTRNVRQGSVTALRFNRSGDRLAIAASKRGAAVLDPRTGRLIRAFGHGAAWSVAFDEAHHRVAAGLDGGVVSLRRLDDGRDAGTLHLGTGPVVDLDFTADGDDLAAWLGPPPAQAHPDHAVIGTASLAVWNLPRARLSAWEPHPGAASHVYLRFSPLGATLAASDGAGWGRVWLRPELPWRPFALPLAAPPYHRDFPKDADGNPTVPPLPPLSLPPSVPAPTTAPPPPARTVTRLDLSVGQGTPRLLAATPDHRRVIVVLERPAQAGALLTVLSEDPSETARPFIVLDHLPLGLRVSTDGGHVLTWDDWQVNVLETTGATPLLTLDAAVAHADFDEAPGFIVVTAPDGAVRRLPFTGAGAPHPTGVPWLPRGERVALAENGLRSAVRDGDIVELWQGRRAVRIGVFPPAGQDVTAVDIAPTARSLAIRYADGDIETYDAGRVEVDRHYTAGADGAAAWVRYAEDGRLLWTMAGPRTLVGWRVADGVEVARIEIPGEGALAPEPVERSPRFVALVPAGERGAPAAWVDLGSDAVRRLFLASEGLHPLAVAPATARIAWFHDGVVSQANLRAGLPPTGPIPCVGGEPTAGAFTERGDRLALLGGDGLVRIYDDRGALAGTVDPRQTGATGRATAPVVRIEFERGDALDFEEGDEYLRTTDERGDARRWQWTTGAEAHTVARWPGSVGVVTDIRAAVVTPDGARLYTGDATGIVRGWDLTTGGQIALDASAPGAITALALDDTGHALGVADAGGAVRLLDPDDLHELRVVPGFEHGPVTLAVARGGAQFAALSTAGILRAWDIDPAASTRRWQLPPGAGTPSYQAGDARWVVTPTVGPGPAEATVAAAIHGPTGPVSARFGWVLGDRAVVVGEDGRVRVWSVPERQLLGTLIGLDDGSWVVDRADGRRISSPSLRDQTAEPHG